MLTPYLNECLLYHIVRGPLRTRVGVGGDSQKSQEVLATDGRLGAVGGSGDGKSCGGGLVIVLVDGVGGRVHDAVGNAAVVRRGVLQARLRRKSFAAECETRVCNLSMKAYYVSSQWLDCL